MPQNGMGKTQSIEGALREFSTIKSAVADAVDAGVPSANQTIKHGLYAADDAIEEAKHTIKQKPLQTVGVVFLAGLLAGGVLTWMGLRRR